MALVLRGLTYLTVLCFVDDCIVTGGTFSEHLANVEEVLKRFQKAGLLLKPTKCQFFQKVVKFLGHVVSSEGIAVDSKKTAVIWGMESRSRCLCKKFGRDTVPASKWPLAGCGICHPDLDGPRGKILRHSEGGLGSGFRLTPV